MSSPTSSSAGDRRPRRGRRAGRRRPAGPALAARARRRRRLPADGARRPPARARHARAGAALRGHRDAAAAGRLPARRRGAPPLRGPGRRVGARPRGRRRGPGRRAGHLPRRPARAGGPAELRFVPRRGARDAGGRARIAGEAAEAARRHGDAGWLGPDAADRLATASFDEASLHQHGARFHELFLAPFTTKIRPAGGADVVAGLRRKLWVPLFWPRTVAEAFGGHPVSFVPERPLSVVRPSGGMGPVVQALLDRLRARGVTVVPYERMTGVASDPAGVRVEFSDGRVRPPAGRSSGCRRPSSLPRPASRSRRRRSGRCWPGWGCARTTSSGSPGSCTCSTRRCRRTG